MAEERNTREQEEEVEDLDISGEESEAIKGGDTKTTKPTGGGSSLPTEQISLNFTKIKYDY